MSGMSLYNVLILIWLFVVAGSRSTLATSPLQQRDDGLPARVPYVFPAPGTDPIADSIRSRRTNGTLLDLDGVLLNAPLVAQGWSDIAGVIRDNNTLPAAMRELFILRTAVLNSATYQWLQHEPVGRAAGLTTSQLLTVRFAAPFVGLLSATSAVNRTLSAELSAALDFADWSTEAVHVPQDIFDNLHAFLSDKQMVEATATVGMYNFVSRFTVGLNIDDKMGVPVPIPQ